jgi:hypothetical protein
MLQYGVVMDTVAVLIVPAVTLLLTGLVLP